MSAITLRSSVLLLLAAASWAACAPEAVPDGASPDSGAGQLVTASDGSVGGFVPPQLTSDPEPPIALSLTNFAVVYVREPSGAEITRARDAVGFKSMPVTDLTVRYPAHTFTITDRECGNGQLRVDGVTHRGAYFALSPDGSITPVAGRNALEALADPLESETPLLSED